MRNSRKYFVGYTNIVAKFVETVENDVLYLLTVFVILLLF